MTVVLQDTIVQVDGPVTSNVAVEVKDHGGRLDCTCRTFTYKDKRWCDHVKQVITDALDKQTLMYGDPERNEPCVVSVPVHPTTGFWLQVELTEIAKSGMALAVLHLKSNDPAALGKAVELGVVLVGTEGRGALRRMVISWLEAACAEPLVCKAGIHGKRRFSKADPNHGLPPNPAEFADVFSIINTGWCVDCSAFTSFDDDIPEI